MVFDLIEAAEREDWTADLILTAQKDRPRNTALRTLCQELGLPLQELPSDAGQETEADKKQNREPKPDPRPGPKPVPTSHIIRLIVVLALAIAALGVLLRVSVQVSGDRAPSEAGILWQQNWSTINEPLPFMSSSEGYSATNRERYLSLLTSLDLSSSPRLDEMRTNLVADVKRAPARPEDAFYNMELSSEIEAQFTDLRRGIRDEAIRAGVSVSEPP